MIAIWRSVTNRQCPLITLLDRPLLTWIARDSGRFCVRPDLVPLLATLRRRPIGCPFMSEPIHVLLLGTFHFVSRADLVRPELVDMGTPARQAEISSLVGRLVDYQPTKVALELASSDRHAINERYSAYRRGLVELDAGEQEQIGFRVAAILGHEKVFPVDDAGPKLTADISGLAATSSDLSSTWALLERHVTESADRQNRRLRLPLDQHLAELNAPEFRAKSLAVYLTILARLVDDEAYDGADMVGNWYHRNARIYANILHAAQPGDRLLVLYGAGHISVLTHLFEAAGEVLLDDPLAYVTS